MSLKSDQQWASERREDVQEIIARHLGAIISIRSASDQEDTKQATDLVVEVADGAIAVRVRDNRRDFRDWTVRSRRDSGAETELAKLQRGHARWYLYCWCKSDGRIGDHVVIDLDRVRAAGLLGEKWREVRNDDGTYFLCIPVDELRLADVLLVDECKGGCPRPYAAYKAPRSVKQDAGHVPDVQLNARPTPPPGTHQGSLFPPAGGGPYS